MPFDRCFECNFYHTANILNKLHCFSLCFSSLRFFSLCFHLCFFFFFSFSFLHFLYTSNLFNTFFLFYLTRWTLPSLYGKVFPSVLLVIQQGATTGIVPDHAGATLPSGPMSTPWSLQEQLFTTGTNPQDFLLVGEVVLTWMAEEWHRKMAHGIVCDADSVSVHEGDIINLLVSMPSRPHL